MQEQSARFSADLVIEAAWTIPIQPHGVVLENHAVAVTGGQVTALLPQEEMKLRREKLHITKNDTVIGCPLCNVIPAPKMTAPGAPQQ